ncbi:HDIG domain-containing protein [Egibacter rhizosphaerae]|uniref:HDIG domain-containing protein n=1 Tax=Egibacter rhizosphaerae TaxID=1670831 RepID=A0A411YAE8_9ACTN|nr:HDIG domain-containing metalloprotein [Egibacter rhizosphaerae]QBI18193.1 HDIG domain-containing protein [Egibacter rhizosphaerae]
MAPLTGPEWLQRIAALLLAALVVPAIMSVSAFLGDTPIREGEPSPRTVFAPEGVQIADPEATEREQRAAEESVEPVLVDDEEARSDFVQDVRDVFSRVETARQAGPDDEAPPEEEQVESLAERTDLLDERGLAALVDLNDEQLAEARSDAVDIAQQLARQEIEEGEVDQVVADQLRGELAVRSFPGEVGEVAVAPLIEEAARPTVRVDEQATAQARQEAASEVDEVVRAFVGGGSIVEAGEPVDEIQMEALQRLGLEGAEPWQWVLRALAVSFVTGAAVAFYLRAYRRKVWASSRKLLLFAVLVTLFAALAETVALFAPDPTSGWLYVLPAGAIAMLATILFDPPVGVLSTIPMAVLVAFSMPQEPGVLVFTILASLASVPLVSRLSARGDLRKAAWQSTLVYILLAVVLAATFGGPIEIAALAGLLNGVATAVIVNGSLPFLESLFGVLTATSLLDLQDRNHPLLRELEQKALGSYNHSIMVSTMVERACRRIGADSLLGSVAALYHDIGKVRRPYFFVENQFGIANPHDELPPEASAEIIQAHVDDGIEMARSSRLPAEVVEGIASHHGTTRVDYFYRQAVNARGREEVDEGAFRYPGRKPASKEMAVLMLADCCEGASRAAALADRNLTRDDLEGIVRGLVTDRVEDGQLDEANLTFRELAIVQDTFVETLVGVYHPRIAYPKLDGDPPTPAGASHGSTGGTPAEERDAGDADAGPESPGVEATRDPRATNAPEPAADPPRAAANGQSVGARDGDPVRVSDEDATDSEQDTDRGRG